MTRAERSRSAGTGLRKHQARVSRGRRGGASILIRNPSELCSVGSFSQNSEVSGVRAASKSRIATCAATGRAARSPRWRRASLPGIVLPVGHQSATHMPDAHKIDLGARDPAGRLGAPRACSPRRSRGRGLSTSSTASDRPAPARSSRDRRALRGRPGLALGRARAGALARIGAVGVKLAGADPRSHLVLLHPKWASRASVPWAVQRSFVTQSRPLARPSRPAEAHIVLGLDEALRTSPRFRGRQRTVYNKRYIMSSTIIISYSVWRRWRKSRTHRPKIPSSVPFDTTRMVPYGVR